MPLPLLVLDDVHDMVIQANAMAMGAFQPPGGERLLARFMPFVRQADRQRVEQAFEHARQHGRGEAHEVIFHLGDASTMQGDLHIACIDIPQQKARRWRSSCAPSSTREPLLTERARCKAQHGYWPAKSSWKR